MSSALWLLAFRRLHHFVQNNASRTKSASTEENKKFCHKTLFIEDSFQVDTGNGRNNRWSCGSGIETCEQGAIELLWKATTSENKRLRQHRMAAAMVWSRTELSWEKSFWKRWDSTAGVHAAMGQGSVPHKSLSPSRLFQLGPFLKCERSLKES